ncbi:unnamed protein product [Linum tenue]|uniref:Transposase IS204/IS1001/IS1096/IS1165 DDE domain-containing protein n=1 Tax=Linum tenue TaxID=586396 RepID=A0AAV0LT83_9ROSI|nr:unnamed protein product [Linum tenue]
MRFCLLLSVIQLFLNIRNILIRLSRGKAEGINGLMGKIDGMIGRTMKMITLNKCRT